MPVHIVMEQARGRRLVRVRHSIAALLGFVLILAGFATVPGLGVLVYLSRNGRGHDNSSTSVGQGTVVAGVAILLALVIVAPMVGIWLVRGSRRLVLFLRRFGYTDATQALTFAALRTTGRWWRLVTLDDAAIAPVGVSRGTERLFAAGAFGKRWLGRTWNALTRLAGYALTLGVLGTATVGGYIVLHHRWLLKFGHAGHHDAIHGAAPGLLRDFVILAIVAGCAAIVLGVLPVVMLPLLVPLVFLSMSGSALRAAEETKITPVSSLYAAHGVARVVRSQARKIFSPRLMVLHVDSEVWRPTVKSVADVASVVLIDVSEPTENLLWELAEVSHDPATACVLVGNAARLRALESSDEPLQRQLAELLDGRTILAYETTKKGMRRFARALRATLEIAIA